MIIITILVPIILSHIIYMSCVITIVNIKICVTVNIITYITDNNIFSQ